MKSQLGFTKTRTTTNNRKLQMPKITPVSPVRTFTSMKKFTTARAFRGTGNCQKTEYFPVSTISQLYNNKKCKIL